MNGWPTTPPTLEIAIRRPPLARRVWQSELGQPHDSEQVHLDHVAEVVHGLDLEHVQPGGSGVVHECAETTVGFDDRRDAVGRGRVVRHVESTGVKRDPGEVGALSQLLGAGLSTYGRDDGATVLGQLDRSGHIDAG